MTEVSNGLLVGVAVGVLLSWFRTSWVSFRRGGHEGADQLKVGIFLVFLSLGFGQRVWGSLIRWSDYDPAMTSSPVLGYILLIGAVGGMLHLAAPGAVEGSIPSHNRNWIMAGVAIGMAFAGFMLGTAWSRVDLTPARAAPVSSTLSRCIETAPVKVSKGGIIHEPGSIWYPMVNPIRCFASAAAAKAAGFRPPTIFAFAR